MQTDRNSVSCKAIEHFERAYFKRACYLTLYYVTDYYITAYLLYMTANPSQVIEYDPRHFVKGILDIGDNCSRIGKVFRVGSNDKSWWAELDYLKLLYVLTELLAGIINKNFWMNYLYKSGEKIFLYKCCKWPFFKNMGVRNPEFCKAKKVNSTKIRKFSEKISRNFSRNFSHFQWTKRKIQ